MTTEAIEHLIRTVPGGTTIVVVTIPQAETAPPLPEHSGSPCLNLVASVDGDPAGRSALERLRVARLESPAQSRKEAEWAADICGPDFSARELERACREAVIPSTQKQDGLDAGARLIRAPDLESYLDLRDRVQRGIADRPAWWDDVVRERRRARAA